MFCAQYQSLHNLADALYQRYTAYVLDTTKKSTQAIIV